MEEHYKMIELQQYATPNKAGGGMPKSFVQLKAKLDSNSKMSVDYPHYTEQQRLPVVQYYITTAATLSPTHKPQFKSPSNLRHRY
jgi:hypothetical protein